VHSLAVIAEAVFALLALCGVGYYCLCLLGAYRFLRSRPESLRVYTPPVSILKPLRGTDREMYESFRSHCLQDYGGEWEFIFGVMEEDDPAIADVERPQRN
jgi:ceramide glucosyltransferase